MDIGVHPVGDNITEISVGGQSFPVDPVTHLAAVPVTLAATLVKFPKRFILTQLPDPKVLDEAEAERQVNAAIARRAEADRLAAEQAEADRVAAEKAEADRVAAEKAEADRVAAEKAASQQKRR